MNENAAPPPPPPSTPGPPPGPPPAPPTSTGGGGSESGNRSVMLVLSYLWLLALIPFVAEKEDPEVQWHAKHGLVLTGAEIALMLAVSLVMFVLDAVLPGAGCLGCGIHLVLWLGILGLHVTAMIKALGGGRLIVPGISEFADRF